MAGQPARQMKRAVEDVVKALAEGRTDDARRALMEAKVASEKTGIPLPQLPPDASQLWEVVFTQERRVTRRDVKETRLSDEVRKLIIEGGELAAMRIAQLLSDDSLFEGPRRANPKDLVPLLSLAMQRAYGSAPLGAQQLKVKPEEIEPKDVGGTLSMMIRSKQQQPAMRDVTPIDVVPEGDREGWDDSVDDTIHDGSHDE
jgi:hypothetical protein